MDISSLVWTSIVNAIAHVPDVIWSGILASLLTLAGVLVANRDNTQRLRVQLEHDGKQKEKDRLATLRKEVYLRAPLESVKASQYLSALINKDLAKIGDDEGINGYLGVAAQISVTSDLETAKAASELSRHYGTRLVRSLYELGGLQAVRSQIERDQTRLTELEKIIDQLQAEQRELLAAEELNEKRYDSTKFWVTHRIDEADELRDRLEELRPKYLHILMERYEFMFDNMPELARAQIALNAAVRREIGLVEGLDEYERIMFEQSELAIAEGRKAMDGLRAVMAADAAEDAEDAEDAKVIVDAEIVVDAEMIVTDTNVAEVPEAATDMVVRADTDGDRHGGKE